MAESRLLRLGEARAGMRFQTHRWGTTTWVVKKATHKTATIYMVSEVDVGPKYRGKTYTYKWDGTGYARGRGKDRQGNPRPPSYLWTDTIKPLLPDPE